mmetsp:Transcript_96291/g.274316  ORF Transcript_96291/g.274316 Transcript_96291/m.274316 type:complete len:113 (+) Transcript_96291:81-419(+)
MASNQPNEVDEVIRELKLNAGFTQYAIMSNDGIVIKCEGMERTKAIQHAHLVLDLCAKSKKYIRELFEPPDVSHSIHVHTATTTPRRACCATTRCHTMDTKWTPLPPPGALP